MKCYEINVLMVELSHFYFLNRRIIAINFTQIILFVERKINFTQSLSGNCIILF